MPEGRRSGETFALIRDAFVQAGRLLGRPGSSERQLSMHITDGRLQIVVSQQDDAKCSSGAASAIASALVHTHRVCRTASVVADVEVRARPLAVLLTVQACRSCNCAHATQRARCLPRRLERRPSRERHRPGARLKSFDARSKSSTPRAASSWSLSRLRARQRRSSASSNAFAAVCSFPSSQPPCQPRAQVPSGQ